MTSKDYLSQEEIDALLRQSSGDADLSPVDEPATDEYINSLEEDALGEIGNITFGSAATALSTLLGKKVEITTPKVSVIHRHELDTEFPKPHVAVHVQYVDGFQGINSLVIRTKDAQVIADLMLGGEGDVMEGQELNEIHVSAVQEAMNQMMGSSATSMSTIFNRFVNISPPGIDILDVTSGEGVSQLPPVDVFVKISFHLKIGDLIDSTIMQLLPVSFAKEMVSTLMGGASPEPAAVDPSYTPEPIAPTLQPPAAPPMQQPPQQPMYNQPPQQPPAYGVPVMPDIPAAGIPMMQAPGPQTYGSMPGRNVNVQPVQFGNFQQAPFAHGEETNLNLLLDIPLKVTVELGRTQKQIKEILELSQGSVIELDKLAGEPVDILVNSKLIAKGEVVVIDENFGVRVTDIVSQWDRLQKLQ
ncbi:flagellar motor switch protein FliN [Paenibacillus darwinianus]|uniref:Flagellar motor switch protein FliN n=1 Tax=Paenibacillus darwinianus TaxID=1380763 RepID=A0A9W5S2D2_9BACL|nr:flagellar motor switch phosphatase FliY [Paenibacillus darwinianus]EXX91337.1 flagellar motor switch protein FliN [Paenibacillus darwinianus]EXX92300.1 flagellar motor switch protein FliN [Paenibacillus darwinianus]EXX92837.1 flagellar motor switch protein FliN [Paenibacillus darwinianus]